MWKIVMTVDYRIAIVTDDSIGQSPLFWLLAVVMHAAAACFRELGDVMRINVNRL